VCSVRLFAAARLCHRLVASPLGSAHYGVTTAGQSVWLLVSFGLIVFALVALPLKLLWVAKQLFPLGPGPAYWALLDKSWTPSFWLFLAVSSFAITPILEELFFRVTAKLVWRKISEESEPL